MYLNFYSGGTGYREYLRLLPESNLFWRNISDFAFLLSYILNLVYLYMCGGSTLQAFILHTIEPYPASTPESSRWSIKSKRPGTSWFHECSYRCRGRDIEQKHRSATKCSKPEQKVVPLVRAEHHILHSVASGASIEVPSALTFTPDDVQARL